MAPSPNLFQHANYDPFIGLPEAKQRAEADILYVTDRVWDDEEKAFTAHRSKVLTYGDCRLAIGSMSDWRQMYNFTMLRNQEDLSINIVGLRERGVLPTPLMAAKVKSEQESNFRKTIERKMKACKKKEIFIFIHGFNNTFDYAAKTTGQLWHYFGRGGLAVTYSWPSGTDGVFGYQPDKESGEFTVFHLKQMLRLFVECPSVEKINILAHSRGTDVTLTALRELNLELKGMGKQLKDMRLNNLVLAAADIDMEVFMQRVIFEDLHLAPKRTTLYLGAGDRALAVSQSINTSARRLGLVSPNDIKEDGRKIIKSWDTVDLVYVPKKLHFIGHSYFIDNPAVSSDLVLLFKDNRAPGAINGRPLKKDESGMWILENDYPVFEEGFSFFKKWGLF